MKKIIQFLVVVTIFYGCSKGVEKNLSESEITRIDYFLNKANDFQLSKKIRLDNNNKAYSILKERGDSVSILYLFKIADRFYNIQENKKFVNVSKTIYELSSKKKDSLNIAKSLNYIADYYYSNFKNDSAYYYYTKAELIFNKIEELKFENRIAFYKANILLYEKNYSQSEINIIKILKRANLEKDHRLIYDCFITLGKTSKGMNDYSTAIDYYEKAYKYTDKLIDYPQYDLLKAQSLNYIALALQKQGKFPEALLKSELALNLGNFREDELLLYIYLKSTLAYSKFKLGDNKCLPLFEETLRIGDSLQSVPIQLTSKLNLSEYYLFQKDSLKAQHFSEEARQLAHKNNVFEDELKALELLAKIDPKNDSHYNQRYITLNDSLQNVERATRNKFARIEFETDEITNQKNLAETEKEKISAQRWMILGFSLFFIVLLMLLYVSHRQRSKNKELQYRQQQQQANEEIYRLMFDQQQKIEEGKQIEKRRISKELHDGVMGKLTAIRLNLFVLNKKTDPETITRCMEHVNEIQNIEKEIRKISHDLNHNLFTDVSDFILMVNNLVDNIKEHSHVQFKIITDEKLDWNIVNSVVKMQVYRILQEALQNIEKYAQANNVVISMLEKEGKLSVTITDDGIGFDINSAKNGIGHKNMRERAAEIKGEFAISSIVGKGTKINLIIPT